MHGAAAAHNSPCSGRPCDGTAAQVAISTQAIRDAQARYQQQWADLIRAGAAGRRATCKCSKPQVQAQGMLGQQLMGLEQQLATQARERSEQALEMATRTEIEQHLADKALAPGGHVYPAGQLRAMPSMTGRQ